MVQDIVIVIVSVIAIAAGAVLLVDSAVRIAKKMGISELVIGLTIVAIGTSAPEFAVTVMSAIGGKSDISVGNIVGSNIFNLGFILGGTALIRSLSTSKTVVYRDGSFLVFGSALLTYFLWDLKLARYEGIILFVLLIGYLGYLYIKKEPVESEETKKEFRWFDPILLVVSLVTVVGSSHFLVDSASGLARAMGVSDWVIGATIVAAGTSAPELATSIVAAIRGHYGISVGNLIGSDLFNLYGVLGVASIIKELPVDISAHSNMLMLIAMTLLALFFMRTKWRVSRWEGLLLFTLGLARYIYSFFEV